MAQRTQQQPLQGPAGVSLAGESLRAKIAGKEDAKLKAVHVIGQRRTKKRVPVIRRKGSRGTLAKRGSPREETVPEGAEKRQTTMPKKQEAQERQTTMPKKQEAKKRQKTMPKKPEATTPLGRGSGAVSLHKPRKERRQAEGKSV